MVSCFLFLSYGVFTCVGVQFHGPSPEHISSVKSIMQKEPEELFMFRLAFGFLELDECGGVPGCLHV